MNQTTDIYKETLATWNKVAALYQEKFMHIDLYNATYDIFCTSITMPDAKILEIGCGPGNVTKYISGKCPQWDVLAIDAAENMVELAKQNNPSSNFLVLDARDINTLGDKYDGVISGFCLPYLSASDTEKLINDSFNLLNNNGLLYLSFVEGEYSESGFQVGSSGDRAYFYFHDLKVLTQYLQKKGFTDINTLKVNYQKSSSVIEVHTILISRKGS